MNSISGRTPILVQVPDLDNVDVSYHSLVNTLNRSDLRLDKIDSSKSL
jgi:hypothetical protein